MKLVDVLSTAQAVTQGDIVGICVQLVSALENDTSEYWKLDLAESELSRAIKDLRLVQYESNFYNPINRALTHLETALELESNYFRENYVDDLTSIRKHDRAKQLPDILNCIASYIAFLHKLMKSKFETHELLWKDTPGDSDMFGKYDACVRQIYTPSEYEKIRKIRQPICNKYSQDVARRYQTLSDVAFLMS